VKDGKTMNHATLTSNDTYKTEMNYRIKLLYYSSFSFEKPSGVATWLKCLAERMPRHEITVVCPLGSRIEKSISLPGNVHIKKLSNLNKFSYGFVPSIQGLRKILQFAHDNDIILVEMSIAFNDIISYAIAKLAKKRLIYVLHCPLFLPNNNVHNIYANKISLALLRRCDAVWVMNSDEERYLKKLKFQRVYRIPYGVDTEKFKPIKKTKRERFVVTFLARLTWQKGIDTLLEAIKQLSNFSQIKSAMLFRIAGYGEEEIIHEVTQLSETNKEFVEYLGAVPHELAPSILAQSDRFVLPSRYETFGIPALEAQSCGVPVVSTNIPGLRDVVVHMKTGLLISPGSASELAKNILWFYELWRNDSDVYKNFCLNARRNALNYDWKIVVSMVNSLLHEVLGASI